MPIVTVDFDNGTHVTRIRVPSLNPEGLEYGAECEPWKHLEREKWVLNRAAAKIFGPRCFWFGNADNIFRGQVFEALRDTKFNNNRGNSSVTNAIVAEILE